MGSYLNPGGGMFKACLRSKIYVDKSGLIAKTNEVLGTEQRFVCVSRPRRFGKSMAANMLAAYYGRGEDSAELFSALRIHTDKSFREHLNQYDVIRINMQEFLSAAPDMDEMLKLLQKRILRELKMQYPDYIDSDYLVFAMQDVFAYTRHPFVILIDEWDCIFREFKQNMEAQKKISGFSACMAERSGICGISLYDRNPSGKKIWFPFCIKYVYGIFHDQSKRNGRVFWIYRRGSKGTLQPV